ncbi:MAG: UvrD-helicase domain-containing protein [Acidobacteriota bacterium]
MSGPTASPIDDRDARRRAQRMFDRPLALEAGAGTGKTATLVARIVAWAVGPGWQRAADALAARGAAPDDGAIAGRVLARIAAITFTEAAAAEMRTRVETALAQLASGDQRPIGLLPFTRPFLDGAVVDDADGAPAPDDAADDADPARVRQRAARLRDRIEQLVVRTIHGFCRQLLAAHPFDIGLHPHFTIDADGELTAAAADEAVRDALDHAYGSAGASAFDADGAAQGDPAWLALAQLGIGPQAIRDALHTLLAEGVSAEALADDPASPARCAALLERLRRAVRATATAGAVIASIRGAKTAQALAEALPRFADALDALDDREPASIVAAQQLAAAQLADNLRKHLKSRWMGGFDKLGKKEQTCIGDVDRADQLAREATILHALLIHLDQLDLPRLRAAHAVLAPLMLRVRATLDRRGVVNFDDLLQRTVALLDARPGVGRQLRRGLDQLLVDEFQDTDRRQCALIDHIAFGGPDGPCLFVVGDPKQSIYGWRSADLAAYDAFLTRMDAHSGLRLALTRNFRSVPAVLDEVTRVVAPVMQMTAGLQPPYVALVPNRDAPDDRTAPAVEHWWTTDDPDAPEKSRVGTMAVHEAAALVADLRARRAQGARGQAAILVRTTTGLEPILDALRDAGLPYALRDDRQYYRRREVIDAIAAATAILVPDDAVATIALLRAPCVGVPDAALPPLWRRGLAARWARLGVDDDAPARLAHLGRAVADDLRRRHAARADDLPGLDRVIDAWPRLLHHAARAVADLRRGFAALPADAWVARLHRLLRLAEGEAVRHLGPHRLARLERFDAQLIALIDRHRGDAQAVARGLRARLREADARRDAVVPVRARHRLDDNDPARTSDDAVVISTIHKAKGLQFDTVYLAQAHRGGRPPSAPDTAVLPTPGGGRALRLFGAPALDLIDAELRKQRLEGAERVRTLYVALTRAANRLVISGQPADGGAPRDAVDPARARTFTDLLAARRSPPDAAVRAAMRAALDRPASPADAIDADGVRWRWVCDPDDAASAAVDDDAPTGDAHATRAESAPDASSADPSRLRAALSRQRRIDAARAQRAAQRMRRPLRLGASKLKWSADAAEPSVAIDDTLDPAGAPMPAARAAVVDTLDDPPMTASAANDGAFSAIATAIGTVVHRVFEDLPLDRPLDEALRPVRAAVDDHLAPLVDDAALRDRARDRVDALLDRFAAPGGALRARWEARVAGRVVARELPVLIAPPPFDPSRPEALQPTDFIAGAIDLVHRAADGEDGALVIVDYKTDRVPAAVRADASALDAWLDARGRHYAGQGRAYSGALRDALGLATSPAFELWFLDADVAWSLPLGG